MVSLLKNENFSTQRGKQKKVIVNHMTFIAESQKLIIR